MNLFYIFVFFLSYFTQVYKYMKKSCQGAIGMPLGKEYYIDGGNTQLLYDYLLWLKIMF